MTSPLLTLSDSKATPNAGQRASAGAPRRLSIGSRQGNPFRSTPEQFCFRQPRYAQRQARRARDPAGVAVAGRRSLLRRLPLEGIGVVRCQVNVLPTYQVFGYSWESGPAYTRLTGGDSAVARHGSSALMPEDDPFLVR